MTALLVQDVHSDWTVSGMETFCFGILGIFQHAQGRLFCRVFDYFDFPVRVLFSDVIIMWRPWVILFRPDSLFYCVHTVLSGFQCTVCFRHVCLLAAVQQAGLWFMHSYSFINMWAVKQNQHQYIETKVKPLLGQSSNSKLVSFTW